jgi:hypothetical protein
MHSCQGKEKLCPPIATWGDKMPCQKTSPTACPPIKRGEEKLPCHAIISGKLPRSQNPEPKRNKQANQDYNAIKLLLPNRGRPNNKGSTRTIRSTNPRSRNPSTTRPHKLPGNTIDTPTQTPKALVETKPIHKQIWDCNQTYRLGLFGTRSLRLCNTWKEPEVLQATIYKYHREEKRIKLYQCKYFLTTNMCKEEFFAAKYKTITTHEEESHVIDCQRAVRNKKSPHNHQLIKRTENTWETASHDNFKCNWLEVNSLKYFGYKVTRYEAIVRSGDRLIHQDVTNTECLVKHSSCRPIEDTL